MAEYNQNTYNNYEAKGNAGGNGWGNNSGPGGFNQGDSGASSSPAKSGGNKERAPQKLTPIFIKQALGATKGLSGNKFTVDGQEMAFVKIVGVVTSVVVAKTNIEYTVDDGTGSIHIKTYVDSAEKQDEFRTGVYLRCVGTLIQSGAAIGLTALKVQKLEDHNELTFHMCEALKVHLLHTKGPLPGSDAKPMDIAQGSANYNNNNNNVNPYGAAAPAAAAVGGNADLPDQILAFFRTNGDGGGVSLTAVHEKFSHLSFEQTKQFVTNLANEGFLYSTIDDAHYASTQ